MSDRKTSVTAYIVAACIVKLSQIQRWKNFCPPEMIYLSTLFITNARDSFMKRLVYLAPPHLLVWLMDHLFVPGMAHHMLFRKNLIESQLEGSIANGVKQVIVIGGGFDSLSIRMAKKHPEILFYEIDLPNTQSLKTGILNKFNYNITANCRFISADLSAVRVTDLLKQNGFNNKLPTFIVLEGVLMYLSEEDVKRLFNDLHDFIAGRLEISFGAIATSDNEGKWTLRLVNRLLGRNQEETNWHCTSADMVKLMTSLGFEIRNWIPYKKLQSFYRNDNEIKNLPDEDENYYLVAKITQTATNLDINQIPLLSVNH